MITYLLLTGFLALLSEPAQAYTLNGTSGLVGWSQNTLLIDYNPTGCTISEETLTQAIDTAANIWNTIPTSRLTIKRGNKVTTTPHGLMVPIDDPSAEKPINTPTIVCDTQFSTTLGTNTNSIPAATWTDGEGYQLNYAFIVLNAEASKGANMKNLSATQVNIVLAHEIGHALGLGHTADSSALMYFSSTHKEHLALSQDDMDGVTYLYPRRELINTKPLGCATISSSSGPPDFPSSLSGMISLAFLFILAWVVAHVKRPFRKAGIL